MTLNKNINSNSLQQFQKLWKRISSLNKVITMVNKEIEVVKSHISELIGIDISSLATFEDLSSLEDSLKQYTDAAVDSVDLSDYATGDTAKNIHIQYNAIPADG
jgi:methionine synthase II (cobalamin-independent)